MTETSTLYVRCPVCKDSTLLLQPARCAACSFDYTTLARTELDEIVLGQLRAGGFHAVAGIELRSRVLREGAQANADAIKAMAAAHGIDLYPKGISFPVMLIGGMVIFGVVLVVLMQLLLG